MSDFEVLVDYLTTTSIDPNFHSDTLILAGNSLISLIISTAKFCKNQEAIQQIVFVGGIGHGTAPLLANAKKQIPELVRPRWQTLSEAEIMQEIFSYYCSRDVNQLLEPHSKNTGENARFSRDLFKKKRPKKFWLVQDPLVQKRTHLTFSKEWELPLEAIQSLIFEKPELIAYDGQPHFKNTEMDDWWQTDYFLSLTLGEIRRLQDNEQGYGPKGTAYIPHVDLPDDVLLSYQHCQKYLTGNSRI
ncbi:YdcF family protein [Enterococcus hermanniensis]|uniref:DUF218 domain-containing protein n=1 Tax=Enterococcus hermanniensis TaxID=249189 RepID=A0A1L8TPJ6_9ENTE|nr:YdcF family protein [Enterococcus hermanniensis]OJG46098.1 hypothetical protein RV04_GL001264 [Enterococcus hermanniensis]